MVPFEQMPHAIAPDSGMIVTANNRVVAPEREPYLSTDPMPPHRTRRIWQRLKELDRPSPEQMPAIHRDLKSIPAIEIRERLRAIETPAAAKELRELILGWNGEMRADSVAASVYSAVRLELTKLALRHSGLDKTSDSDFTKVAPGLFPEVQFWWTLPQLLRSNDESLLNGATWDGLLREAMVIVSKNTPTADWGTLHTPKLKHALSVAFPEHADQLDKDCAKISGDNDCVFMAGYSMKFGFQATSSALSRYVFDVGAWDNCRWIVFHGASGHPASPFYANQNATWAKGELVPMLYDWDEISRSASSHQVLGK
jgi:penicillin amidase